MRASLHLRVVWGPGGGAGEDDAVEGAAAVREAPMTAGARPTATAPRATRRCWGATVYASPTTLSWMVSTAPRGVGARADPLVTSSPASPPCDTARCRRRPTKAKREICPEQAILLLGSHTRSNRQCKCQQMCMQDALFVDAGPFLSIGMHQSPQFLPPFPESLEGIGVIIVQPEKKRKSACSQKERTSARSS